MIACRSFDLEIGVGHLGDSAANEQPTSAFTLAACLIAIPTCNAAGRTFAPVKVTDSALDASLATFTPATLMLNEGDVISRRSTDCASRDWLRALHAAGLIRTRAEALRAATGCTQLGVEGIASSRILKCPLTM